MHKMILVLVIAVFLGLTMAGLVNAASTVDITVTVTVRSLGVTVSPTTWAIGFVEPSSVNVSTAFTVTNTGNAQQDFQLKATDSVAWTIAAVAASEQFRMSAIFKNAPAPVDGDFLANDNLTLSNATSTAAIFAIDANPIGEKGYDVATTTPTRSLWLRFGAPTATAATAEQSITVTITAIAG